MRFKLSEVVPLGNWILITIEAEEEIKTESGIVLPRLEEAHREDSLIARVMRVGPEQTVLKPGDRVILKAHHGSILEPGVLIVSPDQLLAKLEVSQ